MREQRIDGQLLEVVGTNVVIIGAGGHARVVYEILTYDPNINVVGFVDNAAGTTGEMIMDKPIVGDHTILPELLEEGIVGAAIGIGDNKLRRSQFEVIKTIGFELVNAIHPTANIAHNVEIGRGVVISAGATVSTGVRIGDNTIINTGAIIEHEDIIEDDVHISSGSSLAGRVTVKKGVFVGIGSVVKEYVTIGENAVIGAGSVVLEDIPDNATAVGSPSRIVRRKT
jgi:sugar O-acyltransferase (sialic acid O-acetyltransferase NeuD family)